MFILAIFSHSFQHIGNWFETNLTCFYGVHPSSSEGVTRSTPLIGWTPVPPTDWGSRSRRESQKKKPHPCWWLHGHIYNRHCYHDPLVSVFSIMCFLHLRTVKWRDLSEDHLINMSHDQLVTSLMRTELHFWSVSGLFQTSYLCLWCRQKKQKLQKVLVLGNWELTNWCGYCGELMEQKLCCNSDITAWLKSDLFYLTSGCQSSMFRLYYIVWTLMALTWELLLC